MIEWSNIASGVVGGVIALVGNILIQWIAHRGERRRRAERRSEEAARSILRMMDEAHGRLQGESGSGSLRDLAFRLSAESLYVVDENVRGQLDHVIQAFESLDILVGPHGKPRDVGWVLRHTVRSMLGVMLRGERIPEPSSEFEEFAVTIESSFHGEIHEAMREHHEAGPH